MQQTPVTVMPNNVLKSVKQQSQVKPFGAHFATKLDSVNSKLVCALSLAGDTCWDDACGGAPLCR